jgi:hypothetical protein
MGINLVGCLIPVIVRIPERLRTGNPALRHIPKSDKLLPLRMGR